MVDSVDQTYRVGVDIGGTFPDVVVARADGRLSIQKLISTPQDYSLAVLKGMLDSLTE
ncbi:MAG: hydantoinase/oxoprolinase N-terminal domain-containing protein, partial [Woeseiaceae bacterium]